MDINNQKELLLDFKDLLWKLLQQWKAIVLFSLLMSFVVVGAKYFKDCNEYNDQSAKQKEMESISSLSQEEQISRIVKDLSDNERQTIIYVVNEKEKVYQQKKYLEKSILANTDSTNQRILTILFNVDVVDSTDLPAVINDYSTLLKNETLLNQLRDLIAPEAESRYVEELFLEKFDDKSYINLNNSHAYLQLSMVLTEDANSDAVEKAIASAIKKEESIKTIYPHSIRIVNSEVKHIYHNENVEKNKLSFELVNDLEKSINAAYESMTDQQKALVDLIVTIEQANDNINDNEDGIDYAAVITPKLSLKYVAIGFILGVLLYSMIYVIVLLLKETINSASNIVDYAQTGLLGEIYCFDKSRFPGNLFKSKAVSMCRYKEKANIEKQTDAIINDLNTLCSFFSINSYSLIDLTDNTTITNNTIKMLMNKSKNNNLSPNYIEASKLTSFISLLNIKDAVVLVGEETKVLDLDRLIAYCRNQNIRILGLIYTAVI